MGALARAIWIVLRAIWIVVFALLHAWRSRRAAHPAPSSGQPPPEVQSVEAVQGTLRRSRLVIILLVIALITVVPAALLGLNLVGQGSTSSAVSESGDDKLCLPHFQITPDHLDFAARSISGRAARYVSPYEFYCGFDVAGLPYIIPERTRKVDFSIFTSTPNPGYAAGDVFDQTTTLEAFPKNPAAGQLRDRFTIPIEGDTESYPGDEYEVTLTGLSAWRVTPPNGFVPVPRSGGTQDECEPVRFVWDLRSLTSAFAVSIHPGRDMPYPHSPQCQYGTSMIVLSRPLLQQVYVYVLASVPLVLAAVFYLMVWRERHRQSEMEAEQFGIGILGAIFAILPLRLVLVPNDIGSLTRADLILGLGFTSIVGAALLRYGLSRGQVDPA